MKVIQMELGNFATNTYIIYDENLDAVIIDPAAEAKKIISTIEKNNLKPKFVLLTHGHPDHVGALYELKEKYNLKVYINEKDQEMLETNSTYFGPMLGLDIKDVKGDSYLKDGQELSLGNLKFKIIETPGHTKGGVCILIENILFSGDTLFLGSMGRTDFPGGNEEEIFSSLKKLMELPDETVVLPGHGPKTTIGYERKYNPYVRMANNY
ncbi:MBL fold metallo-hydrolase [Peptoniphilus sp. BV3C26]|uniref:MBL fold metallo-hydrolase n=1 Tax=Peptoniphilus sp. BV3C26 TaxID=1111134 RepID=UPI0003B8829A|nr:MBL fold metallo-hydrolase [Peptoniphilus sp. BV3C26]ERT56902.1 metallo-beta-lactamase domain protein [Peptoniphilus sp. BV3C26]